MRDHELEVDRATAGAWRRFQARLADLLAAMEDDDVAIVEALTGEEPDGAAPYVQFCAFGDGMVRGEVASNHVLDERWELGEASVRTLGQLGWAAPTYAPDEEPDHGSLNHWVDLEQSEADRLAVMATRALRDVFGVPHPALLAGDVADDEPAPVAEPAACDRVDEPVAAYPHGGREELAELVDRALTPFFGHEPRHDDDGDIPVDVGHTMLFVRVLEDVPVVQVFGCLVTDVGDLDAARREIGILNRDVRFATFLLLGDSITVDLQLPAWPFVPEHLRAMLAMLGDLVERIERDLAARVGGRLVWDPDADERADTDIDDTDEVDAAHGMDAEACDTDDRDTDAGDEPADAGAGDRADEEQDEAERARSRRRRAELVLAQLDAEQRGSVDPELAAGICGHDPEVILDLIRADEQQETAWRQARDAAAVAGDVEEAAACESELRYAVASTRLLRRALRVVVEHEAARDAARLQAEIDRLGSAAARAVSEGGSRSTGGAEAPGRSGRPRRRLPPRPARPRTVPDPTIEEVDPDIWG